MKILNRKNITGVLVAGGKSRRMGVDKIQLKFKNKSFIDRGLYLLTRVTDDIIVSCNKELNLPYHIIRDEFKDVGPIGGIYTALKNSSTENILVIPADMPYLNEEILNYLLSNYDYKSKACVFYVDYKLQGLVGIYNKSILPLIEKQIESKEYKLHVLLKKSVAQIINGDNFKKFFLNINTIEDYKRLNIDLSEK